MFLGDFSKQSYVFEAFQNKYVGPNHVYDHCHVTDEEIHAWIAGDRIN